MIGNIFTNIRNIKSSHLLHVSNNLKNKKVYDGVFYMLEKDKRYFYIGGSIHIGNNGNIHFNNIVKKAYEKSSKLAIELDITKLKNQISLLKGLSDISNIPTDKINLDLDTENFKFDFLQSENSIKYKNLCKKLDLNFEKCSKLPPEKLCTVLQRRLMKKTGHKSSYGIDNLFINRAKKDKKEIVSLETPSTQIDALIAAANMSPETLGTVKIKSLEDLETSIESLKIMYDAVLEGDTLTLVNDILRYNPLNELDKNNLNKLLFERNEKMANKIEKLILSGEIYFIIVGVAHVIGKGSLLKLFKDKGYKISRLK